MTKECILFVTKTENHFLRHHFTQEPRSHFVDHHMLKKTGPLINNLIGKTLP